MPDVTVDDSDLRKLAADLGRAGERVGAKSSKVIRTSTNRVKRGAESRAPVGKGKTAGNLKRGFRVEFKHSGNSQYMSGHVVNDTREAFFQERGTSRHPAQPSLGPALAEEAPNFLAALQRAASEALDD